MPCLPARWRPCSRLGHCELPALPAPLRPALPPRRHRGLTPAPGLPCTPRGPLPKGLGAKAGDPASAGTQVPLGEDQFGREALRAGLSLGWVALAEALLGQ